MSSQHQPNPTRRRRRFAILTTLVVTAALARRDGRISRGRQLLRRRARRSPSSSACSLRVRATSPGKTGSGFVVDLSLTARNKASNTFLSPEAGYKPVFNNPTAPDLPARRQRRRARASSCCCRPRPTRRALPFHGPNTNLAGLFQINGVGSVRGGLIQTWNTWQIGRAGFGSGPSVLTVFVVKGTAPAVVPDSGLDLISNKVKVPFTITAAAVAAGGARGRERDREDRHERRARRPLGRRRAVAPCTCSRRTGYHERLHGSVLGHVASVQAGRDTDGRRRSRPAEVGSRERPAHLRRSPPLLLRGRHQARRHQRCQRSRVGTPSRRRARRSTLAEPPRGFPRPRTRCPAALPPGSRAPSRRRIAAPPLRRAGSRGSVPR